ncbi:MAG: hypothetical protein LH473_13115, partial [Chitinophagales bacterium]|nr:hypothetical protein [Chitinophagales bacterium]
MRKIFLASATLALSIQLSFSQTWDSMGCGITGSSGHSVYTIEADSIHDWIFAGGNFDSAGCKEIFAAAYWDGADWHGTGQPYNAIFYDFCLYNGEVYAAKNNAVVKLQDTSWVLVGSCSGDAHCLKVFNDKLIAGGEFSKINSTTVHYIAQYDGSTWSPIGNGFTGLDHDVESLAVFNGELIAGGFFDTEFGDTTQLNNIAWWDGTKWQPLTGGI